MAVFTVTLEDKVSGPAHSAAESVRGLASEFEHLQQASLAYHAQQGTAISRSHDKDVLADIKKQQEANLAMHAQDAEAAAGRAKVAEETQKTAQWFGNLSRNASKFGEALEGAKFQLIEAYNMVAPMAAAIGVYAGIIWHAMGLAIRLTQEKEALRDTFDVFTGGGGDKLLDNLEALASSLPYTADQLNAWAKSMISAVGGGEALDTAVRAVAASAAITHTAGEAAQGLIKRFALAAETGEKIALNRKIIAQLNEAGVSVQALAKELGVAPEKLAGMTVGAKQLGDAMQKALIAQGAGPLARLGNTWDSIRAKIVEGFEDAFEDLGDIVDPFMSELKSLASEFFAGGIASKDFAGVIKSILKPAFEVATNFVHFLHLNFLRLQVAILQVRVWLKPVTSVLDQIGVSAGIVNVALYVLKGTVIVLAIVFGLLAVAVALVALPFVVAGLAIYGVVKAVQYVIGVISGAVDHFDSLKAKVAETGGSIADSVTSTLAKVAGALIGFPFMAAEAGLNFVLGLVQAITTGQGPIADAVKALAATAINTIKASLGIKSPSRVMMGVGDNVTAGLVLGIKGGTPSVQGAAQGAGMAAVTGTTQGAQQATGGATGGGDRKVEIHVEKGAIQINGAGDVLALTEEALATLLERLSAQAGLGVPQGT